MLHHYMLEHPVKKKWIVAFKVKVTMKFKMSMAVCLDGIFRAEPPLLFLYIFLKPNLVWWRIFYKLERLVEK